jgi:hypothetical protein
VVNFVLFRLEWSEYFVSELHLVPETPLKRTSFFFLNYLRLRQAIFLLCSASLSFSTFFSFFFAPLLSLSLLFFLLSSTSLSFFFFFVFFSLSFSCKHAAFSLLPLLFLSNHLLHLPNAFFNAFKFCTFVFYSLPLTNGRPD